MQNILLIGEYNTILKNIYNAMQKEYQVQVCKNTLEDVNGIVEITEPCLALISTYGMAYFDVKILESFLQMEGKIPVVMVGSFEECREYISRYKESWFGFVERPATQNDLLEKCGRMLALAARRNDVAEAAQNRAQEECEKKKILVVDDNGVFLRAAKSILEPTYRTIIAKSGEKAVPMALAEHPDLILLDYEMPGWNGKETLENLRMNEETASIPVIFLTGVSDRNHILDVLKMQPQGYVLKPVDGEELKQKIAEVFAK